MTRKNESSLELKVQAYENYGLIALRTQLVQLRASI